jgi:hypothetical protein
MEYFNSLFNFSYYYGFDYLASICVILAMLLLGNKKKFGFLVYCVGSSFAIVFALLAKSPPIIVTNVVVIIINLRGFLMWKSKS